MEQISLRQFAESDHDAVAALWSEVWGQRPSHHDSATVIRKKLALQRELFFVATNGDQIVGTAMGGYDGHRGWLYTLVVSPRFRRQGVGTLLVRHVERALAELGCMKMNLQIFGSNAEVVEFYKTLGYSVEDRISMGKLLTAEST